MSKLLQQSVSTVISLGLLSVVYLSVGAVGTLATVAGALFWVYAVLGTLTAFVITLSAFFAPSNKLTEVFQDKSAFWWVKSILMGALSWYIFFHAGWAYVATTSVISWLGISVCLSRAAK